MRVIRGVCAALLVVCCSPRTASTPIHLPRQPLPEIASAGEEGFHDIIMSIQSIDERPNELAITAAGLNAGKRVGLRIVVSKGMKPGLNGSKIDRTAFFRDGIRLESVGADSDALVTALASLYQVPATSRMRPSILFTAFPLSGTPSKIANEHLNFKIFHDEDNTAGEYCEMYLHVDIPKGIVRLDEKDPDYRVPVIKALALRPAA